MVCTTSSPRLSRRGRCSAQLSGVLGFSCSQVSFEPLVTNPAATVPEGHAAQSRGAFKAPPALLRRIQHQRQQELPSAAALSHAALHHDVLLTGARRRLLAEPDLDLAHAEQLDGQDAQQGREPALHVLHKQKEDEQAPVRHPDASHQVHAQQEAAQHEHKGGEGDGSAAHAAVHSTAAPVVVDAVPDKVQLESEALQVGSGQQQTAKRRVRFPLLGNQRFRSTEGVDLQQAKEQAAKPTLTLDPTLTEKVLRDLRSKPEGVEEATATGLDTGTASDIASTRVVDGSKPVVNPAGEVVKHAKIPILVVLMMTLVMAASAGIGALPFFFMRSFSTVRVIKCAMLAVAMCVDTVIVRYH